jgi:hypothetical protein
MDLDTGPDTQNGARKELVFAEITEKSSAGALLSRKETCSKKQLEIAVHAAECFGLCTTSLWVFMHLKSVSKQGSKRVVCC